MPVAGIPRCPVRGPCISLDSTLTQGLTYGEKEAAALGYDRGAVAPTTVTSADGSSTGGHSPRPTVAASHEEGFQWGDAGIGAAGMLLLLSVGGAATIARRRPNHPATTS